jgi:hypothetical protein
VHFSESFVAEYTQINGVLRESDRFYHRSVSHWQRANNPVEVEHKLASGASLALSSTLTSFGSSFPIAGPGTGAESVCLLDEDLEDDEEGGYTINTTIFTSTFRIVCDSGTAGLPSN